MKRVVSFLLFNLLIYSSVEIYYYALISHFSSELQRLQKELSILTNKVSHDQNYDTIYAIAQQRLGLQKVISHQIKKLY